MSYVATMPSVGFYHYCDQKVSFAYLPAVVIKSIGSAAESWLSVVKSDANLDRILIDNIVYRDRVFRFKKYLELFPAYDETGELLCLEYKPFGIHVFAGSRNELYAELAEQICMLWDEYVCEDDESLTPAAIHLKQNLLGALKEV